MPDSLDKVAQTDAGHSRPNASRASSQQHDEITCHRDWKSPFPVKSVWGQCNMSKEGLGPVLHLLTTTWFAVSTREAQGGIAESALSFLLHRGSLQVEGRHVRKAVRGDWPCSHLGLICTMNTLRLHISWTSKMDAAG